VCEHNSRKRIPSHFVNEVASIAVVEDQVSRAGEDLARVKLPANNRRSRRKRCNAGSGMGSLRCRAVRVRPPPTPSVFHHLRLLSVHLGCMRGSDHSDAIHGEKIHSCGPGIEYQKDHQPRYL
jgi:hypothetical protein